MIENLKYTELTGRIIGSAMTVHRCLGSSNFQEVIYQRALMKELAGNKLSAQNEKEMPVYYKGEIIGKKRLDILVENKVLIEIKAVSQLEKHHFNQLINYLNIFKIEIGLLLNFGYSSLQFKRFVNSNI